MQIYADDPDVDDNDNRNYDHDGHEDYYSDVHTMYSKYFEAHAECSKEAKAHSKFSCQGTQAGCRVQISPGEIFFRISFGENYFMKTVQ